MFIFSNQYVSCAVGLSERRFSTSEHCFPNSLTGLVGRGAGTFVGVPPELIGFMYIFVMFIFSNPYITWTRVGLSERRLLSTVELDLPKALTGLVGRGAGIPVRTIVG